MFMCSQRTEEGRSSQVTCGAWNDVNQWFAKYKIYFYQYWLMMEFIFHRSFMIQFMSKHLIDETWKYTLSSDSCIHNSSGLNVNNHGKDILCFWLVEVSSLIIWLFYSIRWQWCLVWRNCFSWKMFCMKKISGSR